MQWVICYDISESKARRNVLKTLRQGSLTYQKSGFNYSPAYSLPATLKTIAPWIENTDRLLLLKNTFLQQNWTLGKNTLHTENHFILFT